MATRLTKNTVAEVLRRAAAELRRAGAMLACSTASAVVLRDSHDFGVRAPQDDGFGSMFIGEAVGWVEPFARPNASP